MVLEGLLKLGFDNLRSIDVLYFNQVNVKTSDVNCTEQCCHFLQLALITCNEMKHCQIYVTITPIPGSPL